MPRPEKVQAVDKIKGYFEGSSTSFLTEFRGLPVARQQELRRSLGEAGAGYKVLKMTLTRRALNDLGHDGLDEWLTGPTAVTFVGDDPIPAARALVDFCREHEGLVIKAGLLNGQVIGPDDVAAIARIESKEMLLSKIAGAVKGPLAKTAFLLSSFTRDAASVFSQLLDKKEAGGIGVASEVSASSEAT